MVDTTFSKVFHNVWNYTKENWYNFKSYIGGAETSHTICNNYNSTHDVQIMCDCVGYTISIIESDCCFIVDEVYDYHEDDLQHNVVF